MRLTLRLGGCLFQFQKKEEKKKLKSTGLHIQAVSLKACLPFCSVVQLPFNSNQISNLTALNISEHSILKKKKRMRMAFTTLCRLVIFAAVARFGVGFCPVLSQICC